MNDSDISTVVNLLTNKLTKYFNKKHFFFLGLNAMT